MTFAELVYEVIVPIADRAIVPFLYALAFFAFLFGVFRYFFNENSEKRQEGKNFVLWSLVGFFVIFSVWGLVRLLMSILIR